MLLSDSLKPPSHQALGQQLDHILLHNKSPINREAGRIHIPRLKKFRLREVWQDAQSHTANKSQSYGLIPGLPNRQSRAVSREKSNRKSTNGSPS